MKGKKLKTILLCLTVIALIITAACVKPPQALIAPCNVRIENGVLMWDEVEGATEYIVYNSYNGEEVKVKTNQYNLSFIQEEGEYQIDVAAVKQDKKGIKQTEWVCIKYNYVKQSSNEQLQVTKGLNFTKITGQNAYEVSRGSANLNGTVVIPEKYNGLPVVKISDDAFFDSNAIFTVNVETGKGCNTITEKIVLPDTIEEIGEYAFACCIALTDVNFPIRLSKISNYAFNSCIKLSKAELPSSLREIGNYVFSKCAFSEIVLPEELRVLGYAFNQCKKLKQIRIPQNITKIGGFSGCESLRKVELSSKTEEIEDWAFNGCASLQQIDFPETLTSIGDRAFYGCENLSNITLPESVENLGIKCFENTAWYNALPDGLVIINGKYLHAYKGELPSDGKIVIPKNMEKIITEATFKGLNVKSVIFECSLDEMPECIFQECAYLTEVVFKGDIKNIPAGAFWMCSSLTKAVLPEGVETIGEYAFDSTGITNLEFLPSSVKTIENGAFRYSALESANLPSSAVLTGEGIFKNCKSLITVNIGNGTYLPRRTFSGCEKLTEVTLNNGIVEIQIECFYGSGIENIDFIHENTVIGKKVFQASNLKTVIVKNGMNLGEEVFKDCINLQKAQVNSGTSIPKSTFSGCEKLTEVALYDGIERICERAFENAGITQLDFLSSFVKTIEERAFYGSALQSANLPKNAVLTGSSVFLNCKNLTNATIYSGTYLPSSTFDGCEKLTKVTLCDGMEEIKSRAFSNCGLINLDFLPSTVKTIERFAFSMCPLEEIRYPKELQTIDNNVFYNVSVKTHILPVSLTQNAFLIQAENLYYEGTQDQFTSIDKSVKDGVDASKITIYYYAESKEDIDDLSKKYWHYDSDGKTPIVWEK